MTAHARANLPRKMFGRTGIEVSTVGLGCAWIGRTGDTLDEELALQTIWTALENGVTLLDTAPLYQNGQSERMVGRALRERPDLARDVVVETKVGHWPAGFDYSYDMAMRCVEGSMERLGLQHFPLLYIHDAPAELLSRVMGPAGALAALRKLQAEGIVGHIGIAVNDPVENAPYIETGEFAVAVVPEAYSLLNQVAEERIFPVAARLGMGIVIAVPLEKGLLATGVRAGTTYPGRNFSAECLAHVGKIEDVCARHRVSLVAAALQFCTRNEVVATVIPGARTPQEALTNARAGQEPIPEAFWADLQPLIRTWEWHVHR